MNDQFSNMKIKIFDFESELLSCKDIPDMDRLNLMVRTRRLYNLMCVIRKKWSDRYDEYVNKDDVKSFNALCNQVSLIEIKLQDNLNTLYFDLLIHSPSRSESI